MLNYNFINTQAKASQIDTVTIEREYWQLLFLQRLYSLEGTEQFYFKGGTAIRFLLGSFRFSEDLDFTSRLSPKAGRSLVEQTFEFLRDNSGIDLELRQEKIPARFKDISVSFRLLFPPQNIPQKTSVRIDISYREQPITREETVLKPFDYPISPYPLVVHLTAREILAEKVRALFVRHTPRDLFDLWFLFTKNIKLDQGLIKKKIKLYPEIKFSYSRLREKIESLSEKELKQDLNQFLPERYRNFYQKLQQETLTMLEKQYEFTSQP